MFQLVQGSIVFVLFVFSSYSFETRQFFKNSTRRDANQMERDWTASVGGCAAFFVETNNDKVIMVSARHCFNHSISRWCSATSRIRTNSGTTGRCTRVVAADSKYDIAFFETSFTSLPNSEHVLRIASFTPPLQARLKMVGYPGDKFRAGKLTTTEECWILRESINSPHSNMRDKSSLHNCTTYGGNSGGPMILEGTNLAIGLPFTYAPGDYTNRDPWNLSTASYLAQMSDSVTRMRTKLEEAGVVIEDVVPADLVIQDKP